ncbi:MAG TPA: 50S ribosomal protein L4 [Gaiellaceae bacterium]|nr:50S ribosomal protein L4 [Gaiellaceae bacterium]
MAPSKPTATVLGNGTNASLDPAVFAADVRPHLVHETVRAEQAAERAGTRALKTRGLVAGGRGKPWRQKGTGRARAGTVRAAQWTGGGAAFQPRTSFAVKVNKKARRAALRSALSAHAQAGTLAVVDGSAFAEPSTRRAAELLDEWGKERPTVVVATVADEALAKSFRNLTRVAVVEPTDLDVGALVWARSLVVTQAALETVQEVAR